VGKYRISIFLQDGFSNIHRHVEIKSLESGNASFPRGVIKIRFYQPFLPNSTKRLT
jgi:hypothetical protein